MPSGAYTIRNRSRNVDYVALLARGVTKFYMSDSSQSYTARIINNICFQEESAIVCCTLGFIVQNSDTLLQFFPSPFPEIFSDTYNFFTKKCS